MAVLERPDLLQPAQLLLQLADLLEDGGAVVGFGGGEGLLRREVGEGGVDGFGLGHGVEHAGEEGAFLGGDLGGRGVVGDGAVADGPDVVGALDDEVLVDEQAAAGVFLGGELGHEVFDDGAEGVARGPDEEAVGEGFGGFGPVGVGVLGFDGFGGDALDHGFGFDGDGFFFEGRFGVVDQLFGEHGEDVREGFDEGDVELVDDVGDPFSEVLLEEVLELAGEFDARGTAADDNHVEEPFALRVGLVFEAGGFDAVHDALADLLGVADFFQEARVFTDAGDAEGGVFGANTDDEHVEGDLGRGGVAFDFGVVVDVDDFFLVIDFGGFGFVVFDGGLFVAENVADGLHDGAVLNCACRT